MNHFRTTMGWVTRLGVGAIMVALASVAQAAVERGSAKVLAIQGSPEVSVNGSQWSALKKGETLSEGAMVRTVGSSAVDLDLGRNGNRLRVMPASTVALATLTYEETGVETVVNTVVELRSGRVVGQVNKLSTASKYEVKSAKAVTGIRGTRFDISAEGKVVVAEGSVVVLVAKEDGTTMTRVVNASEMFNPVSGVVVGAAEADMADIGGTASSVPGIVALPPLQSMMLDDKYFVDRIVPPFDYFVSRTQPIN